jgi:hypothetical protein
MKAFYWLKIMINDILGKKDTRPNCKYDYIKGEVSRCHCGYYFSYSIDHLLK